MHTLISETSVLFILSNGQSIKFYILHVLNDYSELPSRGCSRFDAHVHTNATKQEIEIEALNIRIVSQAKCTLCKLTTFQRMKRYGLMLWRGCQDEAICQRRPKMMDALMIGDHKETFDLD